jgi:hypothetical protein
MAAGGACAHHIPVTAELAPPPSISDLRDRPLIRGAVLHLSNDQPLLIDIFGLPSPNDPVLVCTNLRGKTGQRPVWADAVDSVFYFSWSHVRFLEIPQEAADILPALQAGPSNGVHAVPPPPEPELEIDEEFLRRVREA